MPVSWRSWAASLGLHHPSIDHKSQDPKKRMAPIQHPADDPNEYTLSFNLLEESELSFSPQPVPYIGSISIGLDTTVDWVICIPLDVHWSKHALKCERQHVHWDNLVLPWLLSVYIQWECLHYSGLKAKPRADPCNCRGIHQGLKVVCVQFDHKDKVLLTVCNACPACIQLVELGMFPCAPYHPSLAISIDMLEWDSLLSKFTAPNSCTWVATMQIILQWHGFHFNAKDSLCRCFTNALKYYQSLVRACPRPGACWMSRCLWSSDRSMKGHSRGTHPGWMTE